MANSNFTSIPELQARMIKQGRKLKQGTCFGCNDSAGMFVDYENKDSKYCHNYSALQREECHRELKRILSHSRRNYDNSENYNIKVLAPEYVKFKKGK